MNSDYLLDIDIIEMIYFLISGYKYIRNEKIDFDKSWMLSRYKILVLDNCLFDNIYKLKNLTILKISSPFDKQIDISNLQNLTELDLYDIKKLSISNLPKLKKLDMSKIKNFNIDQITSSSIKELSIRKSNIDILPKMNNLESLYLINKKELNFLNINCYKTKFVYNLKNIKGIDNYKRRIRKINISSLIIKRRLIYIWNSFLNKTNKEGYNIYSFLN